MTALYAIANDYAKLNNEDLDPELIADTIEGMEGEFSDKIEQLLSIIKNKNYFADSLKSESKKLADRARALNNQTENIKQYIARSMITMDKKKVNAGLHVVSLPKPREILVVPDAALLPSEYVDIDTVFKAKTEDIKRLLSAGEKIEGATLEVGKQSIQVK